MDIELAREDLAMIKDFLSSNFIGLLSFRK